MTHQYLTSAVLFQINFVYLPGLSEGEDITQVHFNIYKYIVY